MNLSKFWEENDDHSHRFEEIPASRRFSNRPDLHAFNLLDRLVPGTTEMIRWSRSDEVFLGVDITDLTKVATEEDLLDLIRCGMCFNNYQQCLYFFT